LNIFFNNLCSQLAPTTEREIQKNFQVSWLVLKAREHKQLGNCVEAVLFQIFG
jgi:hypothetical protein